MMERLKQWWVDFWEARRQAELQAGREHARWLLSIGENHVAIVMSANARWNQNIGQGMREALAEREGFEAGVPLGLLKGNVQ